jgi:hypothetical protein
MGRSRLADAVLAAAGHNFRRLFAWLTFLLLGILIALGLVARLNRPEIGFFTADLISRSPEHGVDRFRCDAQPGK